MIQLHQAIPHRDIPEYIQGSIIASDTPRNLKLAHGQRTLLVTLGERHNSNSLNDVTLDMDSPEDQVRLAQWLAQGQVQAIHSQEATLEDVFIEIAGVRPV